MMITRTLQTSLRSTAAAAGLRERVDHLATIPSDFIGANLAKGSGAT